MNANPPSHARKLLTVDIDRILHRRIRLESPQEGSATFYVRDYLPNEDGKLDVWCEPLQGASQNLGYGAAYTGKKLRELGFNLPLVTSQASGEVHQLTGASRRSAAMESLLAVSPVVSPLVVRLTSGQSLAQSCVD